MFLDGVTSEKSEEHIPKWITNQYDGAHEEHPLTKPVTLPRIASRIRSSKYQQRPSLSTFDSAPPALKHGDSTTSPDRFVAPRRPGLNASLSYRSNKDPNSLTTSERLLRHHDAATDGFNPPRRVISLTAISPVISPRRTFSVTRSGGGGALD